MGFFLGGWGVLKNLIYVFNDLVSEIMYFELFNKNNFFFNFFMICMIF